jgi:hypothetical protein
MNITRTIESWYDLEAFGIIPLTGEACGLMMRLLCDVTEGGRKIVERFLGGTVAIKPGSHWNGGSKDDPHVGSVLLPRGIFTDLAAFTLCVTGTGTVASCKDGTVMECDGPLDGDEENIYRIARYYRRSTDPGTGDRNRHAMSGRVE